MINIQSFAKAKDGTSYKAISSSGFSNSKNVTTSLDTHNIWGQPFNGTEDVSGNLYNVGSITASGNIQTEGDIMIRQLDEENQVVNDGDLTISVKDRAATFSGKDKYTFDGAIEGTDIKANGNLDVTGASTMNGVTVNGDAAFNKNIEVKGQSKLNDVSSNNITNSDTIKTKNLEVTGSAHFFELIIDKIKAAGGAVLFTPANGFKVDIVESVTDGYKLYWQADDGSGNQADNMWKVNDQALCMSFNQAKEGTNHNISNKYYWSLVTAVSDTNQPVSIEEKKYHYIVISTVTKDGTVNPEIGDTIAMLGYRGTDDKKRQSAIYISAYTSLDKGLTAPLLAQYQGINDFNLESHRKSYFDAVGAKFVGNFEVSNGQTIEDYINNKIDGVKSATLTINQELGEIKTNVQDTQNLVDSLNGDIQTVRNNMSTLTQKANSIESNVTSNTTTINNLSGSVTSLQSDMSDVKQTASSITSTVSSMKDEIIGENCMLGLNGQGWSSNTIYEDGGTSFHCESTDWFQSHPIADFSGDYTFSFGVWGGGIQIKILEFRQTYYDDGIYDQYVDFGTYTPCKILTTSSSVSNATLTNYATSGTLSTWTYTNTETITLAVGDNVAVRVTNSTNSRYNSIYGTVSAINTSSKSVTVKAIKLLDQPNTICTLSCPTDKKDGTDINSLHYDEKLGRWWIRFKESSGAAKTFVILFRNPSTSIIGYISRLMIEESVEYPHKYNSTGQASQSMIKQTAESIMISVNDTYVKIGDGNITLNGDTKVNGSLTLNDEDQGFLLLGDSGTTEISPKSIGTYNEFKSKTTNTIKTHYNSTIYGSPTVDGNFYGFSWNVSQKLGTFKKGSYIKLLNYTNVAFANVGMEQIGIGTPSATFYIHENGTLTKTITVGNKTSVDICNYTVVGDNVEVMVAGRFTKNASASIWGTSQDILSPRDTIQPIRPMPSISVTVDWRNEVPTASAFMLIGYDGFAVNFGNNKTVYCGADGFIASYGINEFRITSDGIWRNNHPNIKVLKGTDNRNSPATYTVQEPVDTVLCVGNYCKVIFPPNPYEGQTFRILDKALEETYINSNGKKVVNHKTGGDGKVLSLDYLGGQVFWTYVYIDGRWYESAES